MNHNYLEVIWKWTIIISLLEDRIVETLLDKKIHIQTFIYLSSYKQKINSSKTRVTLARITVIPQYSILEKGMEIVQNYKLNKTILS